VVGDGPQEAELVRQAEALGIAGHTRFLGNRRDIPGILALSEVAVLPSLWEPFGLAALEAMAVETPVVVTNTGGLPEFVTHGENGFLVAPADPGAIADSVSRLLADDALRRQMGASAQATVMQHFTARHVAIAYQRLYERTLAGVTPKESKST
jgi:glycosyltransferase involved in cell wall biosynthesis